MYIRSNDVMIMTNSQAKNLRIGQQNIADCYNTISKKTVNYILKHAKELNFFDCLVKKTLMLFLRKCSIDTYDPKTLLPLV